KNLQEYPVQGMTRSATMTPLVTPQGKLPAAGSTPSQTASAYIQTLPTVIELSSDSDDEDIASWVPDTPSRPAKRKHSGPGTSIKREIKHESITADIIEISSSDSDDNSIAKKNRRLMKKQQSLRLTVPDASGVFRITARQSAKKIVTLIKAPSCWGASGRGDSIAYLLDLTDDTLEWMNTKGELMTMAAVIKVEDQDAWGGGIAGSKHASVKVAALDGVLCCYAQHVCQGIYHCERIKQDLLDDLERYEPTQDDRVEFWELERAINAAEHSSMEAQAAR
ncbi:hypothetical protein PHLCEN_2v2611, partial [Hermanssonia centrifuga]